MGSSWSWRWLLLSRGQRLILTVRSLSSLPISSGGLRACLSDCGLRRRCLRGIGSRAKAIDGNLGPQPGQELPADQHGATYPDMPWEPKEAFNAVADFYARATDRKYFATGIGFCRSSIRDADREGFLG